MACIVIFTVSSLICGIAPSLGLLLIARVIQGAGGGGLQPMAQAILADTFPPRLRGLAFSLYGITAIFAPSIGPTLGGWITDNYTWRWIFLMNLPVGILALFLVYQFVEDPPYLTKARALGRRVRLDYIGFSLLALGVGALQILLDKGQEDDWFGSHFIVTLIAIASVCLVSLVVWEWFQKDPIVDVRLFTNFNFTTSGIMMFIVGGMSFATSVVTTVLARRNQFHQERLASHLTPTNPICRSTVDGLAQQFQQSGSSAPSALTRAYGQVYQSLQLQASTLSYIDTFWLLTVAAAAMFCMTFVLKKNDPRGGEKVIDH